MPNSLLFIVLNNIHSSEKCPESQINAQAPNKPKEPTATPKLMNNQSTPNTSELVVITTNRVTLRISRRVMVIFLNRPSPIPRVKGGPGTNKPKIKKAGNTEMEPNNKTHQTNEYYNNVPQYNSGKGFPEVTPKVYHYILSVVVGLCMP
jgi:hypothetical protein